VGNSTACGNKLSLRFTDKGPLDWTITYVNPNNIGTTLSGDLTAVNDVEYWHVQNNSATDVQVVINLAWDPESNLTPLMTENGISDMRVARHNGTAWVETPSAYTSGSDNYNGSVQTLEDQREIITSASPRNFTLACVNVTKPRIRLDNSSPICGDAGIPILLSTSTPISGPYTVTYTKDGGLEQTLTPAPTSFPAILPTDASGGVYKLKSFKYETNKPGAVDLTEVAVYQVPSQANITTPDQSICGGNSTSLTADAPTVGSGLWSIIVDMSDDGGSVVTPASTTTVFNGYEGRSYYIRWTVSNGACTSADTVKVAFPLMPAQPLNFIASTNPVCQGNENVVYTVPNDPLINTYNWSYSGTGATYSSTTNTVEIDFSLTATSGTLSVTGSNDCGTSAPRNLNLTVNPTSLASITGISLAETCEGDEVVLTFEIDSKVAAPAPSPPFSFVLRRTNPDATYTETTVASTDLTHVAGTQYTYSMNPLWTNQVGATIPGRAEYTYTIYSFSDGTVCAPILSGSESIYIWKRPETGPQYHIPNTFGF
jgi:hypothetical protein